MKKRRKLTSTDTGTLEICSNQTRVLVLGVVHLDSPYQSLHLEAEKRKHVPNQMSATGTIYRLSVQVHAKVQERRQAGPLSMTMPW